MVVFGPIGGGDATELPGGHGGESREDVAQVREGIDLLAATGFDDGVEDGAAFPGSGSSDKQPVLLSDGGGADAVLDAVIVEFHPAIFKPCSEARPLPEGIADGFPHGALG